MEQLATALLRHPTDQRPLRVAIVIGSTRPGRKGDAVARWVYERACQHGGAEFEIVDLARQDLPMLDEPVPAIHGQYERAHTKAWARVIASFDAYVFVTPEYNRSIPAALKNAIDFLYPEWNDKAAGFVSYGADAGGARAVEHLRLVMGELRVADVRTHVALSLFDDFEEYTTPAPRAAPGGQARRPGQRGPRLGPGAADRARARGDVMTATGTRRLSPSTTVGDGQERLPWSAWRLAAVIAFGAFMSGLDASIVNVGLETIARDLHASIGTTQWAANGYLIALAVSLPVCGWLGRRVGVGRLWLVALAGFTVTSGLCALAGNIHQLIGLRVLQGLTAGLLIPAGQTVIGQAVGSRRLGVVMATLGVAVALAPALGPTLGGVVIHLASWPWLFLVNLPLGALALHLGLRYVPRVNRPPYAVSTGAACCSSPPACR